MAGRTSLSNYSCNKGVIYYNFKKKIISAGLMTNLPNYLAGLRRSRDVSRKKYCLDITLELPNDLKRLAVSTLTDYLGQFENDLRGLSDALSGKEPYAAVFLTYIAVLDLSDKEREELSRLVFLQSPKDTFMEKFSSVLSRESMDVTDKITPGEMLNTLPESSDKETLVRRIKRMYNSDMKKDER